MTPLMESVESYQAGAGPALHDILLLLLFFEHVERGHEDQLRDRVVPVVFTFSSLVAHLQVAESSPVFTGSQSSRHYQAQSSR